jgi:hypothetical protein
MAVDSAVTRQEMEDVASGKLVLICVPAQKLGKSDEIKTISACPNVVAEALAKGGHLIDTSGKRINPVRKPITLPHLPKKVLHHISVIDPGPQYQFCIDPSVLPDRPHHAEVHKAF